MTMEDAFGYSDDPRVLFEPSFEVAEGKGRDTLLPVVILYVRTTPDAEQVGLVMAPEMADQLAEQLVHFAQRAREKHWE